MISNNTRVGVIGDPIGHSLSPRIHNYWLNERNINAVYEAVQVKPEDLESFLRAMPEEGFIGVNVTIPHKEAVFKLLTSGMPGIKTEIEGAQHIGAINTVVVKNGGLTGLNTDVYGFAHSLLEHYKDKELEALCHHVLVIGAGGAAKAICASLEGYIKQNNLTLINRTRQKAEDLAQHIHQNLSIKNIRVLSWNEMETAVKEASLLVNTTSLGMKNQPPLDISLAHLPKNAAVTDIVYNPLPTELLKQAKNQGNMAIDGLGMLLYQAQGAFREWFGELPEVSPMLREHVAGALK